MVSATEEHPQSCIPRERLQPDQWQAGSHSYLRSAPYLKHTATLHCYITVLSTYQSNFHFEKINGSHIYTACFTSEIFGIWDRYTYAVCEMCVCSSVCWRVCVFSGYSSSSGLVNGGPHPHSSVLMSEPDGSPHTTTNPLLAFQGRSPPTSTGGVLQYADGPPRILPEDGGVGLGVGESEGEGPDSEAGHPRRIFFSSSSSSSSCSSSSSRLHHGSAKTAQHHQNSNNNNHHLHHHHHHHSPSTQEGGRKRGRRKRGSTGAPSASTSPKRRSFPGLGNSGHPSGSPLNINSMVRGAIRHLRRKHVYLLYMR